MSSLSNLFNGLAIKSKMLDVPYSEEKREHVLERLYNLQCSIENLRIQNDDQDKWLACIDEIINLIQDRDMSLSDELRSYLNNVHSNINLLKK